MSGTTIVEPTARSTTPPVTPSASFPPSRAARELGLKRREFDLAVHLGRVRTVPDEGGGGFRVTRAEVDRVRAEDGFPEALSERLTTVGTTDGAALMNVPSARFSRLARLGKVTPVTFYLNRYRAVVWLYLAEELVEFAADEKHAPLLSGRTPGHLREQLAAGVDLRPRNWRGRHLGFLLRQAPDPWARAAAMASLLDPVQVAQIVPDPHERAHLTHLGPVRPSHGASGAPGTPAAQITARIMTAEDPDEIGWLRAELWQTVTEAREHRPVPRPGPEPPTPMTPTASTDPTTPAGPSAVRPTTAREKPRGLLGWLRREKT